MNKIAVVALGGNAILQGNIEENLKKRIKKCVKNKAKKLKDKS